MLIYIYALLTGLAAGTSSGLLGIGGGILLIPLMTGLLKMDFKHAVVASLVVILPAAISGIIGHLRQTAIENWPLVLIIVVGALIGAQFGVYLCHHLSVPILKKIFGVMLIFIAIKMILS